MRKAPEKRKTRKKVKDLPARSVSKRAEPQVKGGQISTARYDPYKNFKF